MDNEIKNPPVAEQSDIIQEFQALKGKIDRIEQYIIAQETKLQKAEEFGFINKKLPYEPKVSKYEAAEILCVSPRQLQRIRVRMKLKWRKVGKETHYLLKELVEAIERTQCNWNPTAYERALKRVTRLPRY